MKLEKFATISVIYSSCIFLLSFVTSGKIMIGCLCLAWFMMLMCLVWFRKSTDAALSRAILLMIIGGRMSKLMLLSFLGEFYYVIAALLFLILFVRGVIGWNDLSRKDIENDLK